MSGLPQAMPMRQPVMLKGFDREFSSTPTSFAPGAFRKLRRSTPKTISLYGLS